MPFYRTICSFWYSVYLSHIYNIFCLSYPAENQGIFAASAGDLLDSVKTLFIMLSYKSIHKNIRFFHLFMIYLLLSPSFSVTQTYLWHSLQAHNIIRFAIYRSNSAFRRLAADLQNIFT